MRRLLWLVMLAVGLPQAASADSGKNSFAQLRDKARPVESMASFLTSFVGDCGPDAFESKDCQQKVEAFRKQALGQMYYVILDDSAQKLVQPKGFSPQTHEMEFALTPYFEAAGFALTHGAPRTLDDEGRPLIPLIRMVTILGDEVMPMDVERLFRTGNVRMQVIFKPLGLWKLSRKDKRGAYVEGVKAQVLAVRLTEGRTGAEVVSWVSPR